MVAPFKPMDSWIVYFSQYSKSWGMSARFLIEIGERVEKHKIDKKVKKTLEIFEKIQYNHNVVT